MASRAHGESGRTCGGCGAWMSRTAVSCDVCGMVAGSSAPLSSDGGMIEPPGAPPSMAQGYGYGAPPMPPAGPGQPPVPGEPAWGPPPGGGPPGYGPPPGAGPPGYGQPAYGPPSYGPPGGAYPQQTNGKAITALVLGIVGIVICQIASVVAIVLAGQAAREIRYSGGTQTGEGLATAGRVLGWIGVGLFVIFILMFLAIMFLGTTTTPT